MHELKKMERYLLVNLLGPDPSLMKKKNLPGRGLTKVEKHWCRRLGAPQVWATYVQFNPYPTAFPYGNGMVLHFYQQQESSTTKTVHTVINRGLKTYV